MIGDDQARITSPTFLLDLTYKCQLPHVKDVTLHHMDLYRLDDEDDNAIQSALYRLDIPGIFDTDISLIEWGDKLGEENRPRVNYLELKFLNLHNQIREQDDWIEIETKDELDYEEETRVIEVYATEPSRWASLITAT